ncbi:MAG: hypothetical protein JXQ90_09980 [Cyclobacteriaceae bacterium]
MKLRLLATSISLLALVISKEASGQDWKLASEKNGITVYTREKEGSPIKEFKAEAHFDADINKIAPIVSDISTYPQWYDHCKSAREISKTDNSSVYYMEYSMPFPFSNRDIVNQSTYQKKGKTVIIAFQQKEGVLEAIDDIVRMPISQGSWTLTSNKDGTTHVIHQYLGDPAGNVPTGIVNMFLVAGPINTLTQLRAYIGE